MSDRYPTDWKAKLEDQRKLRNDPIAQAYFAADAETVERALAGLGPEDTTASGASGAKVVFNISCVHVPAFVEASLTRQDAPYKNGYDTGRLRIGAEPRDRSRREKMDYALFGVTGYLPNQIYYGAVELNGTGVRFYGDICLVLRDIDASTTILDRNSYDLLRPPLSPASSYKDVSDEDLRAAASRIAGRWEADLAAIAASKILSLAPATGRRITTGEISDGLLRDEDYVEALRVGTFAAQDLQEARITSADAAREAHVLERERHGPVPSAAANAWAQQRRAAEIALAHANVEVLTITESGRVKS